MNTTWGMEKIVLNYFIFLCLLRWFVVVVGGNFRHFILQYYLITTFYRTITFSTSVW